MTAVETKTFDVLQSGVVYRCRFAFLGDVGTGKTSIISRFVQRRPPAVDEPTLAVGFSERTVFLKEGPSVKLMFWDTPGDVRARNGTCNHCNRMSAVFFVYDPTERTSFLHVPRWSEEVDQRISQQCFKYLVATKADVIARNPTSCVVSSDEGQQLAASLGMEFREVNATDINSVDALMKPIVSEVQSYSAPGTIDWDAPTAPKNKRSAQRTQLLGGSAPVRCGCCPRFGRKA